MVQTGPFTYLFIESPLQKLQWQIDQLREFLFDDYGDTVAQLGIDRTRELEREYAALKVKERDMRNYFPERIE